MKHILFTALLFAIVATTATAQRNYEDYNFAVDTLTNQDTIVQEFGFLFKRAFFYSVQIQADSVSGANAGTVYLQVSNDPTSANRRWVNVPNMTTTIDGTGATTGLYEGIVYARRMRVYYITPAGTRKVAVKTNATFKAYNNW